VAALNYVQSAGCTAELETLQKMQWIFD